MKLALSFLVICAYALSVCGQETAASANRQRATIEGIVTKDPDSQPVKKALIELIAENQNEAGNYTAVTGADGMFRIEGVLPGRYRLLTERVGLLDVGKNRSSGEGRLVTLTAGQELKDLHIRLQAGAIVHGRVTDEDGDPLADAQVTLLKQTFAGGHTHWEQAGGERTNDLGEYRVANLPAGNFYVSVTPPPDFRTLIEAGGVGGGEAHNREKQNTSYQTTYYPGTPDRSQAAPVQLRPGDDFPVNFSLTPAPSLSIRGSVVNLPPRTSATIMLQSRDFNLVQNGAEMHKDGSFVIRNVSPGTYTIMASVDGSPVPMTVRQTLQVGAANVDGVRLAPEPGATLRGRVRLESRGATRFDPSQIFLSLETLNGSEESGPITIGDQFTNLAHVAGDGSFEWKDVPQGSYYVQLLGENGANGDWFVKSVAAGGHDVSDAALNVNGGGIGVELVLSANGGVVDGVVVDSKGQSVPNAVVVAVPEPRLRGRMDRYRKTESDQSGHFSLRGIRPGDYTLFAWESVEGEVYYNPEFLKSYEAQGSALRVVEGERKTIQVPVIPEAADQP
jgi:protocatechuate 3,4-dioxygenase beta subunit